MQTGSVGGRFAFRTIGTFRYVLWYMLTGRWIKLISNFCNNTLMMIQYVCIVFRPHLSLFMYSPINFDYSLRRPVWVVLIIVFEQKLVCFQCFNDRFGHDVSLRKPKLKFLCLTNNSKTLNDCNNMYASL